jgi:hypothetical protein
MGDGGKYSDKASGVPITWMYQRRFPPRPWRIDPIFWVWGRLLRKPQPADPPKDGHADGNTRRGKRRENAEKVATRRQEAERARQQRTARIECARKRFEQLQRGLLWLDWGLAVAVTGWGVSCVSPLWIGLGVLGLVFAALRVGERLSNALLGVFIRKKA